MSRIRMLAYSRGSVDSVTDAPYEAGVEYDVPAALADTFVKYELAELVRPTAPPENK